ncbi:Protein Thap2 [Operophtera brumata]|uniref:Protein Thap2 n=1 Tax=Operophtera brumata TaxID=104452 RepID=A0A0L7LSM7_OPEBR|nr:Protein Thap2 [Operophtera brumata]
MRANCSVYGCKSATYNKIGYMLNFHRFPKDPERQKIWKDLCKNPRIMDKHHTCIWMCSLHFEKTCYVFDFLKHDAIPTLNLPKAGFSFYNDSGQAKTDSNNGSSPIEPDEDSNSSPPKLEIANIEEEAQNKELVTKEESKTAVDEDDDDCESVTFSSSEDEEPDGEAKLFELQKGETNTKTGIRIDRGNTQDLTGADSNNDPPPGKSRISPSFGPAEPVYANLPIISGVSTISEKPDTHTIPPKSSTSSLYEVSMSSMIDKVIYDNLENAEERPEDDCSTFAAHVKTRMRNFDRTQKAIAQKLISDILFMADTKQLQLASAIVNPQRVGHNAKAGKPMRGLFSTYVVDSDDDDCPEAKKKK